jgi:hypothetical protein
MQLAKAANQAVPRVFSGRGLRFCWYCDLNPTKGNTYAILQSFYSADPLEPPGMAVSIVVPSVIVGPVSTYIG